MNIQDAAWVGPDEVGAEHSHESGETHYVHLRLVQRGNQFAVVRLAVLPSGRNEAGLETELTRLGEAGGVLAIADHKRDARRNRPREHVARDGLEIRAPPR